MINDNDETVRRLINEKDRKIREQGAGVRDQKYLRTTDPWPLITDP
jgi:hypothetical protein